MSRDFCSPPRHTQPVLPSGRALWCLVIPHTETSAALLHSRAVGSGCCGALCFSLILQDPLGSPSPRACGSCGWYKYAPRPHCLGLFHPSSLNIQMEVMFIWKLLHGVNPAGLTLPPKATETLAPIKILNSSAAILQSDTPSAIDASHGAGEAAARTRPPPAAVPVGSRSPFPSPGTAPGCWEQRVPSWPGAPALPTPALENSAWLRDGDLAWSRAHGRGAARGGPHCRKPPPTRPTLAGDIVLLGVRKTPARCQIELSNKHPHGCLCRQRAAGSRAQAKSQGGDSSPFIQNYP